MRAVALATGLLLAATATAAAGCAADAVDEPDGATAARPAARTSTLPLWRQPPDKPPGPAPAPVVGDRRSFALREVARGLRQPNQLVARPGDDRLYVVEQRGVVRVLGAGGAVRDEPFLDLRARTRALGEQGLLSLAFADEGRTAVVLHTTRRGGHSRVLAIPAGEHRAALDRARTLLAVRQPFENHKGGTVLVDERGRVVVGLGDGGSAFDPGQRAQDPRTQLGKLLRRGLDGRWEVVATGLRNPFRMSFDRETGRLWLGDVGQDRVEEVDALFLPETGAPVPNLGWAAYEGDLPLGRKRLASRAQLTWPVASYRHRDGHCSVTGGFVSRGPRLDALRGRYVFGDFCRGTMWSLDAAGAEDPARLDLRREAERLPGLVSFGEDGRGELYALTIDGVVHRLVAPGSGAQGRR
ncbi:sorbosone dehydrogenase family protein [Conexibacter sp. SYSU D00693]|uniref:PQQ-dependent sugar dehydrogenase n=1 Tax=Conexibacter sp. SYSU D00693 TaxID=2812560 RepID=UPI00196A8F1E|nr:PQQ-dependent sugar dehydrogenase [Conexibacter sp. SYSU D00693]